MSPVFYAKVSLHSEKADSLLEHYYPWCVTGILDLKAQRLLVKSMYNMLEEKPWECNSVFIYTASQNLHVYLHTRRKTGL